MLGVKGVNCEDILCVDVCVASPWQVSLCVCVSVLALVGDSPDEGHM